MKKAEYIGGILHNFGPDDVAGMEGIGAILTDARGRNSREFKTLEECIEHVHETFGEVLFVARHEDEFDLIRVL